MWLRVGGTGLISEAHALIVASIQLAFCFGGLGGVANMASHESDSQLQAAWRRPGVADHPELIKKRDLDHRSPNTLTVASTRVRIRVPTVPEGKAHLVHDTNQYGVERRGCEVSEADRAPAGRRGPDMSARNRSAIQCSN